ncbi:MAG: LON peptidase substrate-binding domain-containing protein [Terrimicrobiaceae bacterium]
MTANQRPDFPDQSGVMILPWVSLFPGAMLPLKIFEERYREMLAECLNGNRVFSIAHTLGDDSNYDPIGGLGVVRACVHNEDGTSNLVLQGLARVEFQEMRLEPYPIVRIAILTDPIESSPKLESLRKKITATFESNLLKKLGIPEGFMGHLNSIQHHGAFTDLVASTVLENPQTRRLLLEELDVTSRMELLQWFLNAEPDA